MNEGNIDVNNAVFVGIDAHPTTHTALAINRFEEKQQDILKKNGQILQRD